MHHLNATAQTVHRGFLDAPRQACLAAPEAPAVAPLRNRKAEV